MAGACCSSSRTARWGSISPAPRTCWRPAASCSRAPRTTSGATTPCAARIWATSLTTQALMFQVLAGLATGGIYASLALALVMIYQATHLVNFAQGEMAMFSTYIAWSLINAGVPYWLAFVLTVAFAFVLGVLIERLILRPAGQAPGLA